MCRFSNYANWNDSDQPYLAAEAKWLHSLFEIIAVLFQQFAHWINFSASNLTFMFQNKLWHGCGDKAVNL